MSTEMHTLVVIQNLLEATNDSNEEVIQAVKSSLHKLSEKYPNDILKCAYEYQIKNKLPPKQITHLLSIITKISQDFIKDIDGDVVLNLIDLCVEEMIKSNATINTETEVRASDVLVALGKEHCIQVMEGIMKRMPSGIIPHYMLVHTLGSLAMTNCYGTVPYVKSFLTKMLPIIPTLKFDHHKQAFAYALGSISYAVVEYVLNPQKAPDPTLTKETFYSEFIVAYDIIISSWLSSRETKVLESILQALGSLILVLPADKVTEQVPRLLPTLLSLYRRFNEPVYITKCICSVLSATPASNRNLLETQLDDVVHHLVEQITPEPDYVQLDSLKNHSEILRCFDLLFSYFPFKMIDHLMQQLKNNNDVVKLKALIVVSHMMNTSDELLKAQLKAFVPVLKQLISDTTFKIKSSEMNWSDLMGGVIQTRFKKVMLKIIVLLMYHGFIEEPDLNLFVSYIVKLCCIQWREEKLDETERLECLEFKRVCDNSLYLLTTSAIGLESQLWCFYLQCYINMEYKVASCSIVRCLSYLANKFKDTPETLNGNVLNTKIFVRSLALLATPLNNYQGTYVLNFIKNYATFMDNKVILLWEKRTLEILKYLEYTSENFDTKEWEYIILRFLNDTILQISDEKWTTELVEEFERHILLYSSFSIEKGFVLLCLAETLLNINNVTYIESKIDSMLCLTRSENEKEVETCSKMVKICAKTHMKIIFKKLNDISKTESSRKSSKFFNFLKDSRNDSVDRLKLALLACYAEIATIENSDVAIQLLEYKVLKWVTAQLKNSKESIRLAALKTITNITEIFHQNQNIVKCIEDRDQMLFSILELLYSNIALSPYILETATSLVKLSPHLKPAQKTKVFKLCFENIYTAKFDVSGATDEKLLLLIKEILLQQVSSTILEEIFCLLQMWMIEQDAKQRLTALNIFRAVLTCYLENMRFDSTNNFELTGFVVGCLIPRCNDSLVQVRIEAIHCINLILSISSKYDGAVESDDLNTEHMTIILEKIQSTDQEIVKEVTNDYARIISARMPHYQLMNFTESLLNGLMDIEPSSAAGVTVVLNAFIKVKGGDMFHHVEDMVVKIISIVEKINFVDIKLNALQSIATLASHHPKAVITTLLMQPLGYETCIPECWRILSEDRVLASAALSHFIRLISGSAVYDEQVSRDRVRIAMHQPLAAISAISDMFCWPQMEDIAISQFPEIFCLLYISLASYIGVSPPIGVPQSKDKEKFGIILNRNAYKLNPAKVALEAFKTFLICSKCEKMTEYLSIESKIENDDNIFIFVNIVPELMLNICSTMSHIIPKLLTNLSNYRTSSYDPQRIAVYAFYCEYVHQRANTDVILLESTVSGLLEGQADSNSIVRQLSLRGLGYLANHNESVISRHSSAILNAFMNGLDEHKIGTNSNDSNSTNIPLESLYGLLHILPTLDEDQFNTVQVNISVRIKPFFESENALLRSVAITLFGKLVAYGKKTVRQNALREQVNNNLICLLLHLSDPNPKVVKACNSSLRNVTPILNAKKFNSLIQDHLIDEAKLNYNTFMPVLIKTMAVEIPETFSYLLMSSLTYLKSKCAVIRANTAFVIGLLCSNLPANTDNSKSLETVANRLVHLLKDNEPNVRAKAAYALSNL